MPDRLFHLALPADWSGAQRDGIYVMSTRGMRWDEVGFIHLSFAHQWPVVRAAFYADVTDELLLLEVDPTQVADDVRLEVGHPETGEQFPHLYAPLPVRAVIGTTALTPPHAS